MQANTQVNNYKYVFVKKKKKNTMKSDLLHEKLHQWSNPPSMSVSITIKDQREVCLGISSEQKPQNGSTTRVN